MVVLIRCLGDGQRADTTGVGLRARLAEEEEIGYLLSEPQLITSFPRLASVEILQP